MTFQCDSNCAGLFIHYNTIAFIHRHRHKLTSIYTRFNTQKDTYTHSLFRSFNQYSYKERNYHVQQRSHKTERQNISSLALCLSFSLPLFVSYFLSYFFILASFSGHNSIHTVIWLYYWCSCCHCNFFYFFILLLHAAESGWLLSDLFLSVHLVWNLNSTILLPAGILGNGGKCTYVFKRFSIVITHTFSNLNTLTHHLS